jgi:hypothetical protein
MTSVRAFCAALLVIAAALVDGRTSVAKGAPLDVPSEVRSDSAPGWLPSEIQREESFKTATDYFSKPDEGRYDSAYAMMTDANKRYVPAERFIRENQDFRDRSGPLKERRFLKVTWGKDPTAASLRGIYAAIDLASQYANVDRHCGFVVLYQKSSEDSFLIMRQENNFIDNATAEKIEGQKSRADLDKIWANLAANCPNYNAALPKGK